MAEGENQLPPGCPLTFTLLLTHRNIEGHFEEIDKEARQDGSCCNLVLERLRQEEHGKFEASLDYRVRRLLSPPPPKEQEEKKVGEQAWRDAQPRGAQAPKS